MSLKTLVLPALALASGVAAQCSASATYTIQNQGDASAIQGCRTYTGSIAIATDVAVDISIDGVQEIQGDFIADNATNLPSLSASSLEKIDKSFSLSYLTVLTSLTFPRLAQVGSINWLTIPRLNALSFTTGIKSADSVKIVDTGLGSLDGIELMEVDTFDVSSNGQLQSINMPLEMVSTSFNVEFNSRMMNVTLPNLEVAYNMTFRNVSGITFPSLASVNGSLGFYSNFFETVSAPNLTSVGGSVSFVSNPQLTNVSMPGLTKVGGALQVANNTEFAQIDGFQGVQTVTGAVDCNGNFTDVQLPNLKNVAGAFNLQSTADISQVCSRYQGEVGKDAVIKGKYTCVGETKNPGGVGSTPTDGSTSTQSGTAARELYGRSAAVTGVLGVFAALLGML